MHTDSATPLSQIDSAAGQLPDRNKLVNFGANSVAKVPRSRTIKGPIGITFQQLIYIANKCILCMAAKYCEIQMLDE